MRENWVFWILLISFIGNFISMFIYAMGYKREIKKNADLSDRLVNILWCIVVMIIVAIALGWIG